MDEKKKGFSKALKELAEHQSISISHADTLNGLLDLIPPSVPRPPGAPAASDDASQSDRHPSSSITGAFAKVPTHPDTPPPVNPFRAQRSSQTQPVQSRITPGDKLGRFINRGLIGKGGMGEVYRVHDPDLERDLVLKVLRTDWFDDEKSIARFLEEARLTAQLDHPGIVPVHELGALDDGRHFFTMREVRGRSLREVIDEYHARFDAEEPNERAWHAHFYSLIGIFSRICEPIAYAHSRGVIHRDLKPANIMVGDFGEVQILDWGLAKFLDDSTGHDDESGDSKPVTPSRERHDTLQGSIVGTPAFMPPEQARGHHNALGPTTDVYSLGAILFTMLDGQRPFSGPNPATILFQVIEGIERRPGNHLGAPDELVDLCLQAMSVDPDNRPAHAGQLARTVASWRDGSTRQEEAFKLIEKADALLPELDHLRARAQRLRDKSRSMLSQISRSAPVRRKRPAWSLEQEAQLLEREASKHRATIVQWLESALNYVPDLAAAHNRLAELYRRDHAEAELQRNLTQADSLEVFLRAHNTGKFDDYLAAMGTLSLHTRPPGARVEISRYIKQDYRIVPGLTRLFGHTPKVDKSLPMGSYLLEISASERATVRYPVYIARQGDWTGSPPNEDRPFLVDLPFADDIDDDEVYIPGSSFYYGGDPLAFNGPPRSVEWVDPFVIQKFPVTHGEFLTFLNTLVDEDKMEIAERYCPKSTGNVDFEKEKPIYRRDDRGYFLPPTTTDNFTRLPVSLVDWHGARAYASWYAARTGQPWRLPSSREWEKAARGVDGRFFPWGDVIDPSWCRMLHSTDHTPKPVPVGQVSADESPYGMRGAAGNIRDWCRPDDVDNLDAIADDTSLPVRGGCWFSTPDMCRLATREFAPPDARSAGTGFRLARSW